jgi:putative hydrolase of the HAD superfamily
MFVFFDIDGTLVDYKYAEKAGAIEFYRKHVEVFKLEEEEFINVWADLAHKHFKRYLSNEISFNDQRRCRMKELFGTIGIELTDQETDSKFGAYLSYYRTKFKPFDDVMRCLSQLRDIQLGVISNGDYKHQIDKLERVGLIDYFSIVVTSGEVGYSKPDKRIFIEACNRVSKAPSECYYVGDDFGIDILGSNTAGMKGIWINRKQEVTDNKNITNINSLNALPEIVNHSN